MPAEYRFLDRWVVPHTIDAGRPMKRGLPHILERLDDRPTGAGAA